MGSSGTMTRLDRTAPQTAVHPHAVARSRSGLVLETAIVLLAYGVVAAVVTWPIAGSLDSRVLGVVDSDSAVLIWWFDLLQHYGYHFTGTTHFTEVGVPYGSTQANGLNIQWAWSFYPAFLMTKVVGPVAAYNLTLLTGLAFSGTAAYALVRRLGVGVLVAGWAGLVYLVFPWHLERAVVGHAQLIHIEGLPLVALSLLLLAERRTHLRLVGLAGSVLLCWLSMGYFGVMANVVVAVASLAWALHESDRRRALRGAAGLTAIAVVVSASVFVASLAGDRDGGVGARRTTAELTQFGLRPLELVVPSGANPVFRRIDPLFWETRKHQSNIQETSNYLGWITILLSGFWVALRFRQRLPRTLGSRITVPTLAVAGVALLLSFPGSISIGGYEWSLMPSRVLWEAVPAFRVPSRWTAVLMLALVILGSLGLAELATRVRHHAPTRLRALVGTAVVALIAFGSVVELRVTHPGVNYDPRADPPEYALLSGVRRGALAEYPLAGYEASAGSEYLLRQTRHRRALLTVPNPLSNENEGIRRSLVDPTVPGAAAKLAAIGVTAVITRPDTLSRALEVPMPDVSPKLGDGFSLIDTTSDGTSVWRVTAAPAPAVAFADVRTFSLPLPNAQGRVVQRLDGPSGTIHVVRLAPGRAAGVLHVTVYADGSSPRRFTLGGRTLTATPMGTAVALPLDEPTDTALTLTDEGDDSSSGLAIGPPWFARATG